MPFKVPFLLTAVTALAACAPVTYGLPLPEQPAFPDFDHYAAVDVADYEFTNWHDDRLAGFRVGDVSCLANLHNGGLNNFTCYGDPMPGFPDDRALGWNSLNGGYEFRPENYRKVDDYTVLPGGRALIVGNTGCAAGDDGSVSCIDGQHHGFVIAATGSSTF